MAAESLAGLLQTSARAPPSHAEAGSTEALTRRHSTEGVPKVEGNFPRPDWTHHLERYKQRAEQKEAHRQEALEGKALNNNQTLKNLDPVASGVRKQGVHEE